MGQSRITSSTAWAVPSRRGRRSQRGVASSTRPVPTGSCFRSRTTTGTWTSSQSTPLRRPSHSRDRQVPAGGKARRGGDSPPLLAAVRNHSLARAIPYGQLDGVCAEMPLVVSVAERLLNTTVIGGLHSGWNVAVRVNDQSALPFCTGKSPAAFMLSLFPAFG